MHPHPTTDPQDSDAPEEWRSVVGYEGWYSVSSLGRVRRDAQGTRTHVGRFLKTWLTPRGYVRVGLCRGSHASLHFFHVHLLVATAFIGPGPQGHGVNHINGVRDDNRPANLEWATPRQNSEHAVRTGLMPSGDRASRRLHPESYPRGEQHPARQHPERLARGSRNGNAKLTEDTVRAIRASTLTTRELAARYGVSRSLIGQVRARTIWKHIAP